MSKHPVDPPLRPWETGDASTETADARDLGVETPWKRRDEPVPNEHLSSRNDRGARREGSR